LAILFKKVRKKYFKLKTFLQNPKPPSPMNKPDPALEALRNEPPVKEPYSGGNGEVAKKAALQAQQVIF